MTNSDFNRAFIQACLERSIYPKIALEQEAVWKAYKAKDLENLVKALDENF